MEDQTRQRLREEVGALLRHALAASRDGEHVVDPRLAHEKRDVGETLVDRCYRDLGPVETAHLVDGIKGIGFKFATRGGMTIGLWDIVVPDQKAGLLEKADDDVIKIDKQFQRGLITEDERYEQVVELWQDVTKKVSDQMMGSLGDENPVKMMTDSSTAGSSRCSPRKTKAARSRSTSRTARSGSGLLFPPYRRTCTFTPKGSSSSATSNESERFSTSAGASGHVSSSSTR